MKSGIYTKIKSLGRRLKALLPADCRFEGMEVFISNEAARVVLSLKPES